MFNAKLRNQQTKTKTLTPGLEIKNNTLALSLKVKTGPLGTGLECYGDQGLEITRLAASETHLSP